MNRVTPGSVPGSGHLIARPLTREFSGVDVDQVRARYGAHHQRTPIRKGPEHIASTCDDHQIDHTTTKGTPR